MRDLHTPRTPMPGLGSPPPAPPAPRAPAIGLGGGMRFVDEQGRPMENHQLIVIGYLGCFQHNGILDANQPRCYGCGVEMDPGTNAWIGHFGLSKQGRHVLWYSIHHCTNCDPWEIGKRIATALGLDLVAPKQEEDKWKNRPRKGAVPAPAEGGKAHQQGKFCWCGLWHPLG